MLFFMIRDFGLLILMLFVSFVSCGYGDVRLQCGLVWLVVGGDLGLRVCA